MTFVADCMLGRLARWLRVLGFDVLYFPRIEDAALLGIARREGRVLLTRDTSLYERTGSHPALLIESGKWEDQVVQVLDAFGLQDRVAPHTRCLDCNAPLKSVPKERARNLAAPFVVERASSLALCRACGRVFWKGSHAADMEARIRRILDRLEREGL
jgi:uncharacterized protein with PIN domain